MHIEKYSLNLIEFSNNNDFLGWLGTYIATYI